jgi:hypothetical protein
MVAIRALFSARLQKLHGNSRTKKASRCSDGAGVNLVECANQFYFERKSKTANSGLASCHRQDRIVPVGSKTRRGELGPLSFACDRFCAQQAAALDHLPEDESRNAHEQVAEARQKG